MRLINAHTLEVLEFRGRTVPKYAIVSHRWEDEEVTYEAMRFGDIRNLQGRYKLEGACREALEYGCEWVWLDTCCIDKSSSAELTEAINSMYKWYKNSHICLAYLYDCRFRGKFDVLRDCKWFSRGWTLQELIAPPSVTFFDRDFRLIGTKAELGELIAQITGIDISVLRGADPSTFSVAQRFSWAAGRQTTQVEDQAYSLLGIFNVSMPMVYGEGERAFIRLQEEIMRTSNDMTIFAWNNLVPKQPSGLLAHEPSCFAGCRYLIQGQQNFHPLGRPEINDVPDGFAMTNVGISVTLRTIPYAMNTYLAILNCCSVQKPHVRYGILLEKLRTKRQYARVAVDGVTVVSIDVRDFVRSKACRTRDLLIRQVQIDQTLRQNYAFWIRSIHLPGYSTSELARAKVFSRDGAIVRHNGKAVMQIPNGQCGTAGIINLRSRDKDEPWWRVEFLVFGFTPDFEPCFMLGNSKLGIHSHSFVRKVVFERDDRSTGPEAEFSNSWLHPEPGVISSRSSFKREDHCILNGGLGENTIDYLNVTVKIQLVYAPESLDCLRTGSWTVLAVDIDMNDGPSPQVLAERDMIKKGARSLQKTVSNDLPRGIKQAMLGTLGLEALGLTDLAEAL